MGVNFSVSEIFEIAIEIEKNGYQFYQSFAKITDNNELKKVLTSLANMEKSHESQFVLLSMQLTEDSSFDLSNIDEELKHYLAAFAQGHVFMMEDDTIMKALFDKSSMEILKHAINLEKDSIIFYLGLKDLLINTKNHSKVDAIIHEEMNHINTLSREIDRLIKKVI